MENGGFHGYDKIPNSSSELSEVNVKLLEINHDHQPSPVTTPTEQESECTVREQDRFMPIANVIRIMRKILPPHAKISDDAKETIQECVSEYISFVTGEANERCQREQRKTITAEDVLWAMSKLGFDDYIEPLTLYLHHYREMEGVKRTADYGGGGGGLGLSTAFHLGHHRHGFLGYLKDSPSSLQAMPKEELHPQPAGYTISNKSANIN